MALIVQKYGGSSLASPRHIQLAADRIKKLRLSGNDLVVVVSAMGHTTDHLLKLANRTVKRPPLRELDMLLTAGERVSMSLLAMSLQELQVPAISFTGSQSGIVTNSDHSKAKILEIRPQRIQEELQKGKVVIIAGFQGVSREKEITTLGRGGSDTTAVALSAVLKADRCEILTDVDAIYSADPRIVSGARPYSFLSYDECLELSSLGAKMQSRSIELAKKFGVPIWIGSSQSSSSSGTRVGFQLEESKMEQVSIKGVTTKDGFSFFNASLSLSRVADLLADQAIALRFFSLGKGQTSFLVEEADALKVKEALDVAHSGFEQMTAVSIVSLVGEGVTHSKEVLPRCLKLFETKKVDCFLISMNSLSLTFAVPTHQKSELAKELHQLFIEK